MATTFTGHEFYSRKILKALPAQLNFLGAFSTDVSGELLGPSKSVEVPLVEMDAAAALRANGGLSRTPPRRIVWAFGPGRHKIPGRIGGGRRGKQIGLRPLEGLSRGQSPSGPIGAGKATRRGVNADRRREKHKTQPEAVKLADKQEEKYTAMPAVRGALCRCGAEKAVRQVNSSGFASRV